MSKTKAELQKERDQLMKALEALFVAFNNRRDMLAREGRNRANLQAKAQAHGIDQVISVARWVMKDYSRRLHSAYSAGQCGVCAGSVLTWTASDGTDYAACACSVGEGANISVANAARRQLAKEAHIDSALSDDPELARLKRDWERAHKAALADKDKAIQELQIALDAEKSARKAAVCGADKLRANLSATTTAYEEGITRQSKMLAELEKRKTEESAATITIPLTITIGVKQ